MARATSLVWHIIFWKLGKQDASAISLVWHMMFWSPVHQYGKGHFSGMAHDHLSTWTPDRMCHFSNTILYDHSGHLTTTAACILATRSACATSLGHPIIICFNSRAALIVPYISLSEPPHTGEIEKKNMEEDSGKNSKKSIFITQVLNTFVCILLCFFVF